MTRPLRIAVPKGRLLEPSLALFGRAGVAVPSDEDLISRRLQFEYAGIEWILIKDGDVPVYVESGAADGGISGLDQILEHEAQVMQPLELPFGRCRMMLIAAPSAPPFDRANGLRLATKYPKMASRFLASRAMHMEIISLQGSVELAAVLGLAPFLIDLVETGTTLRVHGLEPLETVREIGPRLIVNRSAWTIDERLRLLVRRIASELGSPRSVDSSGQHVDEVTQ